MSETFLDLFWLQFWQVTFVVLVAMLVNRFLLRRRSHLSTLVWLIVLIKCLTPPVWNSPSSIFSWLQPAKTEVVDLSNGQVDLSERIRNKPAYNVYMKVPDEVDLASKTKEADVNDGCSVETPSRSSNETGQVAVPVSGGSTIRLQGNRLPLKGFLIWVTGAVVFLMFGAVRYLAFWVRIRTTVKDSKELTELAAMLRKRLRVRRRVRVRVTDSRFGPAVVGIFRPMILLPQILVEAKAPGELEPILAHEINHLRRGDIWYSGLQHLVISCWWFHPLIWWINRVITREIENCCDESTVARMNYSSAEYARSLLDVVQLKQLKAVPSFPGVRGIDITKKRLERIMNFRQGSRRSIHGAAPAWCWMIAILAGLFTIPGAAFVVAQEQGTIVPANSKREEEESRTQIDKTIIRSYDATKALEAYTNYHKIENEEDAKIGLKAYIEMMVRSAARHERGKISSAAVFLSPEPEFNLKLNWNKTHLVVATDAKAHDYVVVAMGYAESSRFDHYVIELLLVETNRKIAKEMGLYPDINGKPNRMSTSILTIERKEDALAIAKAISNAPKTSLVLAPKLVFGYGATAELTEGYTQPVSAIQQEVARANHQTKVATNFIGRRARFHLLPKTTNDKIYLGVELFLSALEQPEIRKVANEVDAETGKPSSLVSARQVETACLLKPGQVFVTCLESPLQKNNEVTVAFIGVSPVKQNGRIENTTSETIKLIRTPFAKRNKKKLEPNRAPMVMKLYSVTDIVKAMEKFATDGKKPTPKKIEESLVKMLREFIPAREWNDESKVVWDFRTQSLIVNQTISAHRRIALAMTEYRLFLSHQIVSKNRFYAIPDSVSLPKKLFGRPVTDTELALADSLIEKVNLPSRSLPTSGTLRFQTMMVLSGTESKYLAKNLGDRSLQMKLEKLKQIEKAVEGDRVLDGCPIDAFAANWKLVDGKKTLQANFDVRPNHVVFLDVTRFFDQASERNQRIVMRSEFDVKFDMDSYNSLKKVLKQQPKNAQPLPKAYYLKDDIQYFPKGPEMQLWREAENLKDQRMKDEVNRSNKNDRR